MGISFTDSQTRQNLMRAFAGESQARNRYTIAAQQAHSQQLEVISAVFLYTAEQERAHAKVFYDLLEPAAGTTIGIDGTYPVDLSDNIPQLLRSAQHNEEEEFRVDYPAFAKTATEEGFALIGKTFEMIAGIEGTHAQRFDRLATLMEQNKLFVSDVETGWICLNCGQIVHSKVAPALCPVCKHNQGYFVRLALSPWVGKCGLGEYQGECC